MIISRELLITVFVLSMLIIYKIGKEKGRDEIFKAIELGEKFKQDAETRGISNKEEYFSILKLEGIDYIGDFGR